MRIFITGLLVFSSSLAAAGTDSGSYSNTRSGLPSISATENSTDTPLERGNGDQHPCYKDPKVQPSKKKMDQALKNYMDSSKDRAGALQKFNQATTDYEYQVEECKRHPPTS